MAQIEFETILTLEVFPDKVNQLLDSPEGPVGRAIKFVAEVVLNAAKPRIGDRYSGQHPGPRIRDTGRVEPIGGASYAVVFDHPIAFLHHQGAPAHGMPPKTSGRSRYYRAGPGVVTSSGDTVFGPTSGPIAHPGSPGNPFIRDAAEAVGLRPSGQLRRGQRPADLFRLPKTIS